MIPNSSSKSPAAESKASELRSVSAEPRKKLPELSGTIAAPASNLDSSLGSSGDETEARLATIRASNRRKIQSSGQVSSLIEVFSPLKLPESVKEEPSMSAILSPRAIKDKPLPIPTAKSAPLTHGTASRRLKIDPKISEANVKSTPQPQSSSKPIIKESKPIMAITKKVVPPQMSPTVFTRENSFARERKKTESEKTRKKIREIAERGSDKKETVVVASSTSSSSSAEEVEDAPEAKEIAKNVRMSLFMQNIEYTKRPTIAESKLRQLEKDMHRISIDSEYSPPKEIDLRESEEPQLPEVIIEDSVEFVQIRHGMRGKRASSVAERGRDRVTQVVTDIRKRQILEQPTPKKLEKTRLDALQKRFEDLNSPRVSSDKEHLGRPVQKLDQQRKYFLEEKMLLRVEQSSAAAVEPTHKLKVVKRKTEKENHTMLSKIEEKLRSFQSGPATASSFEEKSISEDVSPFATDNDAAEDEFKKFPDIEVVIDSILENSSILTEFAFDEHPFFLSIPGKETLHKTMSKLFAEALCFNRYFTTISLHACGLGDVFLNEFCNLVRRGSARQLEVLNLKGNYFTSASLSNLLSCLQIGFTEDPDSSSLSTESPLAIRKLNISNQLQTLSNDVEELMALTLKKNTKIVELTAKMNNGEARQLVKKYLARNKDLHAGKSQSEDKILTPLEIRIRSICLNNDIDEEYFEIENDFTFKLLGAKAHLSLAKGLRTNTILKSLKLVNVELHDTFAFCLAESLVDNTVLEILDLQQNHISFRGILAISESFKTNRSLKNVHLDNQNPPLTLDEETQMAVAESLESNTSIMKFGITLESAKASDTLQKYISRNLMTLLKNWGKKT